MATATAQRLLLLIATVFLFSTGLPAAQPPHQAILDAAETLSNSGYIAMSLTLRTIAATLPLPSATNTTTAVTIFSPPDAAFKTFGQPSLAHLLLHFSPLSLSPNFLRSLRFSSKIPSLSTSQHLTITTTPTNSNKLSINNVTVFSLFHEGSVLVYGIETFFPLNFTSSQPLKAGEEIDRDQELKCLQFEKQSRFGEAYGVLKSRGYSTMASFLDVQVMGYVKGFWGNLNLTVFAPIDEELVQFSGDLLMRHLLPCKLGWNRLNELVNGTLLPNNFEGFNLEISRSEDERMLMVNGVDIIFPGMYVSDWLVIHGIGGFITKPQSTEEETDMVEFHVKEPIAPYHSEF